MKNYRFYSFVNRLYMSHVQWGIQTAHCVSSMMAAAFRAQGEEGGAERLADVLAWAEQSPTIMICDGLNVGRLLELEASIGALAKTFGLPFAAFREDQQSLGGVITAVSILVPEEFFDVDVERADGQAPVFLRKGSEDGSVLSAIITEQSDPERHALMSAIKLCELAR